MTASVTPINALTNDGSVDHHVQDAARNLSKAYSLARQSGDLAYAAVIDGSLRLLERNERNS